MYGFVGFMFGFVTKLLPDTRVCYGNVYIYIVVDSRMVSDMQGVAAPPLFVQHPTPATNATGHQNIDLYVCKCLVSFMFLVPDNYTGRVTRYWGSKRVIHVQFRTSVYRRRPFEFRRRLRHQLISQVREAATRKWGRLFIQDT